MSQSYLNNYFLLNQSYVARELNSASSSDYDAESEKIDFQNIFNFGERNTNEMTNEDKNNLDENKLYNVEIDVKRNKRKNTKFSGRKRKGEDNSSSSHTKYSDDNSRRKVKRIIITELQDFINFRIEIIFGDEIGEGMLKKKLMKLCQDQIQDASIQFNLAFLEKTLREIFSENISTRITNYPSDRNKQIVEELINDKNEVRRKYFDGLFKLTFLDCLKYFRNDEDADIEYLKGFKKFDQMKDKIEKKNGKHYTEHISEYLNKYEQILYKKRPRKRWKRNEKKLKKFFIILFNY